MLIRRIHQNRLIFILEERVRATRSSNNIILYKKKNKMTRLIILRNVEIYSSSKSQFVELYFYFFREKKMYE